MRILKDTQLKISSDASQGIYKMHQNDRSDDIDAENRPVNVADNRKRMKIQNVQLLQPDKVSREGEGTQDVGLNPVYIIVIYGQKKHNKH